MPSGVTHKCFVILLLKHSSFVLFSEARYPKIKNKNI